jgi:hypothetical protein
MKESTILSESKKAGGLLSSTIIDQQSTKDETGIRLNPYLSGTIQNSMISNDGGIFPVKQ